MRKTKIICTMGPATDKEGVVEKLIETGMNVARCNFSHGSYEEHKARMDRLKAARAAASLWESFWIPRDLRFVSVISRMAKWN